MKINEWKTGTLILKCNGSDEVGEFNIGNNETRCSFTFEDIYDVEALINILNMYKDWVKEKDAE